MKREFGAIPSPIDIRDYQGICSVSSEEFPEEFSVKMGAIKDQGSVGSCVAHSIAEVIESFNIAQGETTEPMSVGYIYGNRLNSVWKGKGMITRDAIAQTLEYGDVPYSAFPYNKEIPDIITLWNEKYVSLFPKGYPYRFTSYYRLNTDNDVKASLMQHGAVVIAMSWYKDTYVLNGVLHTTQDQQYYSGGHALALYGWNKQGWLVQNSWGADWGNNGTVIIPYDLKINEKWGIIDEYSEAQKRKELENLTNENEKLKIEKAELAKKIDLLTKEILELRKLEVLTDEQKLRIDELLTNLEEVQTKLKDAQAEIERNANIIEELKKQLLEVKQPNKTLWKVIVKIINFIVNIFRKKS